MVRTRFAPSPTGFLHIGGVRTALFAWLVARQAKGQFILRIEDTDRTRHVEESEKHIMDSLQWLGLDWDEGPYRQSERLDIYKEWGQKLMQSGRAYADPYSPQELEDLRAEATRTHRPFLFRDYRPANPPAWDGKRPLRFKSEPKDYGWCDEVMGELKSGPEAVDDFIIIKSDGFPTYNFAHIIDDHLMKVSHVIRSQEFLPSVPKYLNLYDALGIERPKLATLPYVLAPDGQTKLSKRHGAKDILDYKRQGYLPEALINFLATLGWNDGTTQEIFSQKELIVKFSLERVQRGGAKIDEQRLAFINGYWIRQKPIGELYKLSEDFWPPSAQKQPAEYKKRVLSLVQERLKHLSELPQLTRFFFEDLSIDLDLIDNNKQLTGLDRSQQKELLKMTLGRLSQSDFSQKGLTDDLNNLLSETNQKPAVLFSLIRIATTWAPASPGLADTLALLGRDRSLERLKSTITVLGTDA
ncbi:MAG: glutamate--tRNA ligase [Candidatus Saccharimonadales bacterium]